MLRQAGRALLGGGRRAFSRNITSSASVWAEAAPNNTEEFLSKFEKVAPSTLAPPNFPTDFLPEKKKEAPTSDKLTLSFYLPHDTQVDAEEVDLVLLPAVTGDFGVMAGHVPTVAQLRPGVLTVHRELDKVIEKYFVSSGFAFVHQDSSTDVCAVEAVKLEDLDPEAVRAGLAEYNAKLASLQGKADDYEIAAAQVGVEVYSAMNSALGG